MMFSLIILISSSFIFSKETQCNPECSWICDDLSCSETRYKAKNCLDSKCHIKCSEVKEAPCESKCDELVDCDIVCTEVFYNVKSECKKVCKKPQCYNNCKIPKSECEAICEPVQCDYIKLKTRCPCKLVCENKKCPLKVECCECNDNNNIKINTPYPIFRKNVKNKECCSCEHKKQKSELNKLIMH